MSKSIVPRTGLRAVVTLAITASFLGAMPASGVHAAVAAQTVQTGESNESQDVGAMPSVSSVVGANAEEIGLGENPDAGTSTTPDERFTAAAVLGWTPRDELSMSDKDFVIVLWEKADEFFHIEVKTAAKEAFADMTDGGASAAFIRVGIFEANERDAALKVVRAQRDAERLSAAQEVNWVPTDDEMRTMVLRSSNANFLFALSRKAEAGSEVRKEAEEAVDAPEEQQLAFIATGVHDAAKIDRANKRAAGKQKEVEEQQAKQARDIKAAAVAAALGRVATMFELEQTTERDLIYKIKTEAAGDQVRLAATVAYDSENPEDWHAFLATGVHLSRAADLAERDRAAAAEDERKVREILNNATFDKYRPNLVAAANKALQDNSTARSVFLQLGSDKMAALDVVKPIAYMTIALSGVQSGRCIQVAGGVDKANAGANAESAPMELRDCNENSRQRWELRPVTGDKFSLLSVNSRNCLAVPAGKSNDNVRLIQLKCDSKSTSQQWTFLDTGKSTMEVRSVVSNRVVSVPNSATANGSAVHQGTNTHAIDQQWRVIDFSHHQSASAPLTGKVRFEGLQSGRCIQLKLSIATLLGPELEAPTELWGCDEPNDDVNWLRIGAKSRTWEFVPVAGNRFALKNEFTDMCLDVLDGKATNGAAVGQYECHYHGTQQWVLMSAKSGSYTLRNALTGTYLSVKADGTANGSVVHAWSYANKDSHRWIPQPIK